jgi:hypothetical protein
MGEAKQQPSELRSQAPCLSSDETKNGDCRTRKMGEGQASCLSGICRVYGTLRVLRTKLVQGPVRILQHSLPLCWVLQLIVHFLDNDLSG